MACRDARRSTSLTSLLLALRGLAEAVWSCDDRMRCMVEACSCRGSAEGKALHVMHIPRPPPPSLAEARCAHVTMELPARWKVYLVAAPCMGVPRRRVWVFLGVPGCVGDVPGCASVTSERVCAVRQHSGVGAVSGLPPPPHRRRRRGPGEPDIASTCHCSWDPCPGRAYHRACVNLRLDEAQHNAAMSWKTPCSSQKDYSPPCPQKTHSLPSVLCVSSALY